MNDINFIETDAQKIYEELIKDFEKAYGETLYPGDERRIFLQQQALTIVSIKNVINDCARQNLLRYARGEKLIAIGEDFHNTTFLKSQKSICTGKIKLTAIQNKDILILQGKRVTPDGTLFFIVKETVTIPAGEIEKICILEAMNTGSEYNNFIAGQIKNIVDPIPFVESITNTTTSLGGTDIEAEEHYRERCRLAPESYSTAGPEKAYEYLAKSSDPNISDVKVISPSPGVIQLVILLSNGEIPSQEILDKVLKKTSEKDKRPLTDKVEVVAATVVNYDINLTYYLDKEHLTEELKFRKLIEGEKLDCSQGAIRDYINWQQENLGRDINIDQLKFIIQNVALYTTTDNKNYTAVRRIDITSPVSTEIKNTEVTKVVNINITYGGLE